jgi:hypothetical protein
MTATDSFEHSTTIDAAAMQVLFAFLDAGAIKTWWKARNAVVQPRPGGLFVVEWPVGAHGKDDILGPSGGVLAGVLDKSMGGHFVYFGALHWLTPNGDVFGPTRLEIDVFSKNDPRSKPTLLRVRGSAFQSGPRWERYRDLAARMWETTLADLKTYCERQAPADAEVNLAELGGAYLQEAALQTRRIS